MLFNRIAVCSGHGWHPALPCQLQHEVCGQPALNDVRWARALHMHLRRGDRASEAPIDVIAMRYNTVRTMMMMMQVLSLYTRTAQYVCRSSRARWRSAHNIQRISRTHRPKMPSHVDRNLRWEATFGTSHSSTEARCHCLAACLVHETPTGGRGECACVGTLAMYGEGDLERWHTYLMVVVVMEDLSTFCLFIRFTSHMHLPLLRRSCGSCTHVGIFRGLVGCCW